MAATIPTPGAGAVADTVVTAGVAVSAGVNVAVGVRVGFGVAPIAIRAALALAAWVDSQITFRKGYAVQNIQSSKSFNIK
jgi:hypothetical protein